MENDDKFQSQLLSSTHNTVNVHSILKQK